MKKILSIAVAIAAIFAIASCGGNEKKADPAAKTVETLEKLYEQLDFKSGDDAFIKTYKSMEKYYDGLSESDQEKSDKARDKWAIENPDKMRWIESRIETLMFYHKL